MNTIKGIKAILISALSLIGATNTAYAEGKIRIAQQFGIPYLSLDIIRPQKLIEKYGKEQGLDIQVDWQQLSGGPAMNEALLANSLDIVSAGVPPFLTLWDRTHGKQNVKAIASLGNFPNYLLTSNPNIQSLKDFSAKDRIALPAAGTSYQARILQIGASKTFGPDKYQQLDAITQTLSHPDASAALISGGSEINSHFSTAPFHKQVLQANPQVRQLLTSYDILGGPTTLSVLYTTEKFRESNPKTYQAFYQALNEAVNFIQQQPEQAAAIFIQEQKSKLSPETVLEIIKDGDNQFTLQPQNTYQFAELLQRLGVIKNRPESWQDYFFAEATTLGGS
ncbi:MAG: ABC transporter substrate-binding protein [Pelistega sp.]|nr:ABC transporter substrate-binding protein [Pelistega sp.]